MPKGQPIAQARYGPDAICVVGLTCTSATTPIAVQYDKLLLVLVLDRKSGRILDVECNTVLDITSDFLASLFVGQCFYTDLEQMIATLNRSYQGLSLRALAVCLKDAYAKMLDRSPHLIADREKPLV